MTDTEAEVLGKRLVACRHFRPLRGMLDMQGRTWDTSLLWRWNSACDVPDLRDPATLGCVLALVRQAWEPHRGVDPVCSTMQWSGMWGAGARCGAEGFAAIVLPTCPSEAEALVAALEAAP